MKTNKKQDFVSHPAPVTLWMPGVIGLVDTGEDWLGIVGILHLSTRVQSLCGLPLQPEVGS